MRAAALTLFVFAACDKTSEGPATGDPAATAAPMSAAPSSPGPQPTSARTSLMSSGSQVGSSSRSSYRGTASASSASAEVVRPLAAWMRGPATAAIDSGDLEAIALAFEQMAAWVPPATPQGEYTNWASISIDGSRAARMGSLEAVKAACRSCHVQYEGRYRSELGLRPLPPARGGQ